MRKILLLVSLMVLAGVLYLRDQDQPESVAKLQPAIGVPAVPSAAQEPRYPIPAPPTPPAIMQPEQPPTAQALEQPLVEAPLMPPVDTLPALNASNAEMSELFSTLFGADRLRELFNLDEIIRRFVVTIDTLPNKKMPRQHVLVTRAAGSFQVEEAADGLVIAADNAARYAPFLEIATQVDAAQWVTMYVRFYALFQEAYAEVASPGAYFNDRLVDVIEHLLNTPVVDEPIQLVKPKVFYQYADADLESRSAGQKILLRMGNAGAEQIKAKLREIRRLLVDPSLLQVTASPQTGSVGVE